MTAIDDLIPSSTIPEGVSGDVRIERFEVARREAAMFNLRLMINDEGYRAVAPGTYTRLIIGETLVMSDTPAEKRDHVSAVSHATGDCLVMGLGLGMVAAAMARKPEVRSVTVIEINPDVIALVAPHMPENVEVIEADALEWRPPAGKMYGVIWHDIWSSICTGDIDDRKMLKRRFARRWTAYHGDWAAPEVAEARRTEGRLIRYA